MIKKKRIINSFQNKLNITSLVDIALTLVIGFIVALPYFFETGIFVSSSKLTNAQDKQISEFKVSIFLTDDERIILNETKVSEEILKELLPKLLARSVEKRVIVSAENNVRYERAVRILDLAKQAGAKELTLVRKREK